MVCQTSFFKDLRDAKKSAMNEIFFVGKIVKPIWVCLNDFLGNNFGKEVGNIQKCLEGWEEKLKLLEEETLSNDAKDD